MKNSRFGDLGTFIKAFVKTGWEIENEYLRHIQRIQEIKVY